MQFRPLILRRNRKVSISHNKALLVNNRMISVINQALPIHKTSINETIACDIQENAERNRVIHNLLSRAKNSYRVISILLFFISMILIPWETAHAATPVVTTPVKWHPGHYYTLLGHGKNSDWYLSQVYKELKATPALKGVQIRYDWAELETSPGVYNFYPIVKRLSELSAIGKRLVVVIQMKSFGDGEIVPDYLLADVPYGGGIFKYQSSNTAEQGSNIKLWNPAVYERMAALIRALGNRFNSHDYFEGIGLTETVLGQPIVPITATQLDTYYDNLLKLQQEMRHSFPNTVTFQFANYPRPLLTSFVPSLVQMGAGLGGPDVFLEEPGLHYTKDPKGVYHYYAPLSGVVPLTPSVMPGNYRNTKVDGTGYEPTPLQLLQFARDELKANYIFWHRLPENKSEVLQMLNWDAQRTRPAGGLQTACPSTFFSCVN